MGGLIDQVSFTQEPRKMRVVVVYSNSIKMAMPGGKWAYQSGRDVTYKTFDVEVEEQFQELHEHLKKQGYNGG